MMDKDDEIGKEIEATSQAEKAFEGMAEKTPEREIVVPEGDGDRAGTLTKRSETSPNLSDMQTALARLMPEDLGDKITNKLMVARVSPDAFMALLRMLTANKVAMTPMEEVPDIPLILAENYILLTKALDGKGIIDLLEVVGAVREAEELSKLGGGLGM